ncbi:hypothetical protein OPV22_012841 [Ensete ventricosum]|uniref:Uncharacterized protein n=1 Tax=Ensete ventricosum TaxID=4639 RepID=A0AAV8R412_ENSVE|nr:hypothetical protein OPV22_012841 [Ensete ventricosum]
MSSPSFRPGRVRRSSDRCFLLVLRWFLPLIHACLVFFGFFYHLHAGAQTNHQNHNSKGNMSNCSEKEMWAAIIESQPKEREQQWHPWDRVGDSSSFISSDRNFATRIKFFTISAQSYVISFIV